MSLKIFSTTSVQNPFEVKKQPAQIASNQNNTAISAFSTDSTITPTKNIKPFSTENDIDLLLQGDIDKANFQPRSIEELPDFSVTPLRVGIVVDQKQTVLTIPSGNLYVESPSGEKKDLGYFENKNVTIKNENNSLVVYDGEKVLGIAKEGSLKVSGNLSPVAINGKKYRGDVQVLINPLNPSTLNTVNSVMIEDYLKGVVPAESSASWPLESLKAQTLAARTYAIANWKKRDNMGFDVMSTVSDQVYKGVEIEHPATNQAISETKGQVILSEGKPINALFFSCSGGHTDNALDVWNADLSYIKGVPDFDQAAPRYTWQQTLTNDKLKEGLTKLGHDIGSVKSIKITEYTEFKRAKRVQLTGTKGTVEVDAGKLRLATGLNSTFWESIKVIPNKNQKAPSSFQFDGRGWGHGLGMSQWGARQMAEDGKPYQDIVKHYYTNVEIGELPSK
jgi:stage II sporulation protein D